MRHEQGMIKGPLVVTEDLLLQGMITDGATVKTGANLVVRGMITERLVVEQGATATIYGMITGPIHNHGGTVELHGVADEIVDHSEESVTTIFPSAVVKLKRT